MDYENGLSQINQVSRISRLLILSAKSKIKALHTGLVNHEALIVIPGRLCLDAYSLLNVARLHMVARWTVAYFSCMPHNSQKLFHFPDHY